jgi:hypothetical protein
MLVLKFYDTFGSETFGRLVWVVFDVCSRRKLNRKDEIFVVEKLFLRFGTKFLAKVVDF